MKRSLVLAGVALALAVSACGTTVPMKQDVTTGSGAGAGGLSPVGEGATGGVVPGAAPGQTESAGAGARTGATGGATSGTREGSVAGPGSSGPVGTVANGRGVTATTLTVGIPIAAGGDAYASSLGISGAAALSDRSAFDAAIADVNRTGGVLGRKLVPYYREFQLAAYLANPGQVANEICADFRDDHHVFAVFSSVGDPVLRDCTARMGSPLVGGSGVGAILPASAWEAHGGSWFYSPNAITVERLAKLFIESLVQRDFHQKWDINAGGPGGTAPVRLGLIHVDTPDNNALYAAYARQLAKYGLTFTDTVTYAQNVQAGLAATQNAVLKFRADGITHVYGSSAFFLQDAENQHYRPRYAYIPGLGALGAANSPAAQLRGALTVGWSPTIDVDAAQDPGDTRGAAVCRAVMKRGGIVASSRSDQQVMYTVCDLVVALRTALTAGGVPTVQGLRSGFESLGSTLRTALTFDALLGPRRHYGVDSVRDMAYDTGCSCLRYTSRTDRR
jgi:hypothetical protein